MSLKHYLIAYGISQLTAAVGVGLAAVMFPVILPVTVTPALIGVSLLIAAGILHTQKRRPGVRDRTLCPNCEHPISGHDVVSGCSNDGKLCGCLAQAGPVRVAIPLGIDYITRCRCINPAIFYTERYGLPYHHCPEDETVPYRNEDTHVDE